MTSRMPLKLVLALAACTWVLVLAAQRANIPDGFFEPLTIVTGVIAALLAAFDRWVWRWPGIRQLVGLPYLAGTWVGELRSSWVDPKTGAPIAPIAVAAVVQQTSTSIVVTMFTQESQSVTVAGALTEGADGRHEICGLYRNEPKLSVQDRSRVHYGGLRLQVAGNGEERLVGSYWTDRDTRGELEFSFCSLTRARDFAGAMALRSPGAR